MCTAVYKRNEIVELYFFFLIGIMSTQILPKTLLYTKKFHDSPGIYKLILKTTIISIFLVAELNP